jgi:hypothetical protein
MTLDLKNNLSIVFSNTRVKESRIGNFKFIEILLAKKQLRSLVGLNFNSTTIKNTLYNQFNLNNKIMFKAYHFD